MSIKSFAEKHPFGGVYIASALGIATGIYAALKGQPKIGAVFIGGSLALAGFSHEISKQPAEYKNKE